MDQRNKQLVRPTPSPIRIYDARGNAVYFSDKNTPSAKGMRIANVPASVRSPVLGYRNFWSRDAFQPGEYDLAEIGRAADTDSYLARSFKKKVGLLMKEGFRFIGKNPATIRYVKTRLAQIERATMYPFQLLMKEIASDLVKYSNAYIVKVRNKKASGGRIRQAGGIGTLNPIAGYFRVPPETVYFKRDFQGQVIEYQQKILTPITSPKTGRWPRWKPQDIIHIYHDRKGGFSVGTPDTTPVLDDVRVLRRMEEDVELLVYQHLFPLYHYMVGSESYPAQVFEDGSTEVDHIQTQVEDMPAEGCIVTPERHNIEAIGAQGKALKADPFLKHFKERVWAGLAMSSVDFGEGSTANRNTADALSQALIDCVKDFQGVLQIFFDFFVLGELLLESTFTFDVLQDEHRVSLQFNEIDIEQKIKRDSNAVNLYQGHVMTETEARKELGEEPLLDDQRGEMFFEMIEKPRLIIQALDEPFTPEAKEALAANTAPSAPLSPAVTSPKPGRSAKSEGKSRGGKAAANKVQPENQHGKKTGPEKRKSSANPRLMQVFDAFREAVFVLLFRDLLETIRLHDHSWRRQMARLVEGVIVSKYQEIVRGYFYKGIRQADAFQHAVDPIARVRIKEVQEYATRRISYLTDRVLDTIESLVLQGHDQNMIKSALDSFEFRADFLDRTIKRQATMYGQAIGLLLTGHDAVYVHRTPSEDDCKKCDPYAGNKLSLEHLSIDDIPPWHDNCNCRFSLKSKPVETEMIDASQSTMDLPKNPENKKVGLNRKHKDDKFDPKQLALGTAIEFEHTEYEEVARNIAKDHLVQYPFYYDYLADMEEAGHEAMEELEGDEEEEFVKGAKEQLQERMAPGAIQEMEEEGNGPGKHRHISDNLFDRKELLMGIEIEYEHTNDMAFAREIAKDHLAELPDYYTRLHAMQAEINELMDFHIHRQSDGEYTGPPEEPPVSEGLEEANHVHLKADGETYTGPEKGQHGIHTHKGGEGPPVFDRVYDEAVQDTDIEDLIPKVERCVISVKKDLRKRHPTWSGSRVKSSAIAICRSKFEPGTRKNAQLDKINPPKTKGKAQNNACMRAAKVALRKGNKGLTSKEVNALAERMCKMHALQPKPVAEGALAA